MAIVLNIVFTAVDVGVVGPMKHFSIQVCLLRGASAGSPPMVVTVLIQTGQLALPWHAAINDEPEEQANK